MRVEDYKRPSFEVELTKPDISYQLGDLVHLNGSAVTFSGVPLMDGEMKYTIKRKAVNNWRFIRFERDVLIASGEKILNDKGEFTIPVDLIPSADYNIQNVLYYRYIIEASVTSLAGETQWAVFCINAANRSMLLGTDLPERVLKNDSLKTVFTAYNLNREDVSASGDYMLYAIKPGQSADDAKKSEPVYSAPFNANETTSLSAWNNLPSGQYLLVMQAKDSEGKLVTDDAEIILFSLDDKRPPTQSDMWEYAENVNFDAANPASG